MEKARTKDGVHLARCGTPSLATCAARLCAAELTRARTTPQRRHRTRVHRGGAAADEGACCSASTTLALCCVIARRRFAERSRGRCAQTQDLAYVVHKSQVESKARAPGAAAAAADNAHRTWHFPCPAAESGALIGVAALGGRAPRRQAHGVCGGRVRLLRRLICLRMFPALFATAHAAQRRAPQRGGPRRHARGSSARRRRRRLVRRGGLGQRWRRRGAGRTLAAGRTRVRPCCCHARASPRVLALCARSSGCAAIR